MKIGIYGLGLGELAVPKLRQVGSHQSPPEQVRDIVSSRFEGWLKRLEPGEHLVVVAETAEPYVLATEWVSTQPNQERKLIWAVDESIGI